MKFGVDPDGLRDGSATFSKAARELEWVEVGAALEPLSRAFPGGLTAAVIRDLGQAWGDRLLRVRLGIARAGEGVGVAGESYDIVEQVARRALSGPAGRR